MPDDYYVLPYSGEELDDLLGKVGSAAGAVRYDAAQSLTDAQKQQARENIIAAPGGYGFGERPKKIDDPDKLSGTVDGVYHFASVDHPIEGIESGLLIHYQGNFLTVSSFCRQIFYVGYGNYSRLERIYANGWQPWEWVNPPMELGVEYRTTERYLGKPVYVKVVNFGALPANNSKVVQHGISNYVQAIKYDLVGANDNACMTNFPGVSGIYSGAVDITIITTSDVSGKSVNVIIYYTTS